MCLTGDICHMSPPSVSILVYFHLSAVLIKVSTRNKHTKGQVRKDSCCSDICVRRCMKKLMMKGSDVSSCEMVSWGVFFSHCFIAVMF